ncbi:BrnA antitoxin family protein [Desulfocicer vacuolatum]|nr:BrnA antitoxin family protein [Desulfocicer vacuolatum]
MNKNSISETFMDDEYPEVTQADFDKAVFRRALKPLKKKQRITIMLDADLVKYFKAKAGKRGYQTLINDTLRRVISTPSHSAPDMETMLRQIIREELSAARE